MAIDMGSELDNQNRMVDRINAKVIELATGMELLSKEFVMKLFEFSGWIEWDKDSCRERAGSSAPQINYFCYSVTLK